MTTIEYVECTAPFAEYARGFPRVVRRGQTFPADDPVVVKYPARFQRLSDAHAAREQQVEQATAAPGETRRVQIPRDEDDGIEVPAELTCEDCGYPAKSDHALRIHRGKAHKGA